MIDNRQRAVRSLARMTKAPYSIQARCCSQRLKCALVTVIVAGLTRARSLDRQVKTAQKNVAKVREKPDHIEFDPGDIDL